MPPAAMRLQDDTLPPPSGGLTNHIIAAVAAIETNNNRATGSELELLAKLEEANRLFESDAKSLNSLSGASATSGHSRKSSDTSQISLTSGTSSTQERPEDGGEEDLWVTWGHIVNDWENNWKKQNAQIRELVRRGIPLHFRPITWQLLCKATDSTEKKLYAEYIKASLTAPEVSEDNTLFDFDDKNNKNTPKKTRNLQEEFVKLEGRRLVDIQYFLDCLKDLNNHEPRFGCNLSNMNVVKEIKNGYVSTLKFKCAMCNGTYDLQTTTTDPNQDAVLGAMMMGAGYSALAQLSTCLEIPFPSRKTYQTQENILREAYQSISLESMKQAGEREKELAIEAGELSPDGIPMITVVADGCWAKRSYKTNYNSLSGAAAIIGCRTKQTKSPCEKVIRRDIARTYPEHEFFKEKDGLGQESLFNVIKAYSLHDREVGYCQGTGFIVGLLLMQMPEEEAFAVLVRIMEDYRMRDMFKPSMAELGLCMYQLENLVAEYLPDLNQHFQSQNFHTSMYASSWFLTLFTTALSLPLACRIIDVFLSEGMEIIFKVALAMLTLGKEELMSLDMEGMLKYFQKELPAHAEADPEALMQTAYEMKYNAKKMKKLEKEYIIIKTKEQEEMAELKRLRQENKQLKHRCEMLEEESKALADRLVRGQVSRAEEEETTFVVQRELDALRHTHLETTHHLALANERIRALSLMMEETHTSRQSSMEEITLKQEQLLQREEMIECLQEELVKVRLREAENDAVIRDLRSRIHELEEDKKTLRETTPDNNVAHLQEELIAVKLREAEANLSLKDVRHRVAELSEQWQKHLQDHKQDPPPPPDPLSTPKKLLFGKLGHNETQKLEEELMTTKIREMETLTEVKELRLKVMELETQVQVSTNQLRRQDDEIKKQIELLEGAEAKNKEAAARLLEEQRRYSDLESQMKDELMRAKISDAEKTQAVATLMQQIGQLELKSQEIATEGELRIHSVDASDKVRELQDKVADLQAEVIRLERSRGGFISGRLSGNRSSSIDSTDEDSRLVLDDSTLRFPIVDSPTSNNEPNFSELTKSTIKNTKSEVEPNAKAHTKLDVYISESKVPEV